MKLPGDCGCKACQTVEALEYVYWLEDFKRDLSANILRPNRALKEYLRKQEEEKRQSETNNQQENQDMPSNQMTLEERLNCLIDELVDVGIIQARADGSVRCIAYALPEDVDGLRTALSEVSKKLNAISKPKK